MFEERNEAEKGFAAIWDEKIAPGLALYGPEYRQKKNIAIYGNIALVFGVIAIYALVSLIDPWTGENGDAIFMLVLVMLGVGAGFGVAYPHTKLVKAYTEYLQNTVADHFAEKFSKPEGDDKGRAVTNNLAEMDMIKKGGRRKYTNLYVGNYRDCSIVMFNLETITRRSSGNNTGDSSSYFWVLEVGVPMAFEGTVQIRRDYGRLVNKMRGVMVEGKQVPFDHADFEKKYEVYAADAELAYRLISPAFCDNLLAIDDLMPKARFAGKRSLSGMFQNGNFVLVINDFADVLDTDSVAPDKVEDAARKLIARMNLPLQIVDYLHGDR